MARFGRDFVRAATQPAYTEGLFTAAENIGAAPAKRRMQEQLASASPLDRFDIAISQLTNAGKLGEAARLTAQRDKYVADEQARREDKVTSLVAAQMFTTGASEVPESITIGDQQLSIPSNLRGDILEEVNTLQTRKDARELAMAEGKLSQEYQDYFTNNPQLLEGDPMLSEQYSRVTSDEPGMLRTARVRAVKSLIEVVDNDRKQRSEAKTGEKALAVQVENLMEKIRSEGSRTWMWMGNDMADFLEDAEDDEIKLFKEQAVLKLQQNRNATEQEVIDYGMSGMREKISGQKQSDAISENEERLAAQEEANIKGVMEARGISREEAINLISQLRMGLRSSANNRMNQFVPPPSPTPE